MKSVTSRKTGKAGLLIIALLLGAVASEFALAHGGRGRSSVSFGVFVGAPAFAYGYYPRPFFGPAFYPAPFYYPPVYYPPVYYPPVVVTPPAPPVYIEQGVPQQQYQPAPQQVQPAPQSSQENTWYYCAEAQAYYPYVKQCAGGWQRVAPQQPPG